ncbi:hypothetical protein ABZ754_19925 [Micromonospora purpureochromogenes]
MPPPVQHRRPIDATPTTQTFPLDRAPEAYDLLRRGEIQGRAVVVP